MYISIIIPLYNAADILERCINSWAEQTIQNFELLFVDDGSTDLSYLKLKDIQRKYLNYVFKIKIVCTEHKGVSHARNIGLMEAKGDIIGFCDVDDVVHKSMVEFVIKAFEQSQSDIVCTHMKNLDEIDIIEYLESKFRFEGYQFINTKEFKKALCFNYKIFGSVWNKYIKRTIAQSKRFDEELSMCEDTHYIYTIINSNINLKIIEIAVPLYGYVNSSNSVTNDKSKLFDEEGRIKYCNAIKKILEECSGELDEQKWLNAKQFELISGVCIDMKYKSRQHLKQLWNEGKCYLKDYILCNGYSFKHRMKRSILFFLSKVFYVINYIHF